METDPKDIWTMLKTSWTPLPRWLSAESGEAACAAGYTPVVPAPLQNGPACLAAFEADAHPSSRDDAAPPMREKRKVIRDLRVGSSARVERELAIKRGEENTFGEHALGYCKPAREVTSTLKMRNRKRKIQMGNVVDLRPRLREEMYATEILNALCAACEAHAAGEDELLMARIKMLYHMFDDTGR